MLPGHGALGSRTVDRDLTSCWARAYLNTPIHPRPEGPGLLAVLDKTICFFWYEFRPVSPEETSLQTPRSQSSILPNYYQKGSGKEKGDFH
jgi:hypothetical protein